jgi:hypothetical protein
MALSLILSTTGKKKKKKNSEILERIQKWGGLGKHARKFFL